VWTEGRQGSGYFKLKLFESKRFKFDIYLLKFPFASYINWHTDPSIDGYEHHRLNIVLKKAKGGRFMINDQFHYFESNGRFNYFRPDIQEHAVSIIYKGTRYVLSIGWLRRSRA
jgi:hypothetical protein